MEYTPTNTHTSFNAHMKLIMNSSFYTHVWREIKEHANLLLKIVAHVEKFLPAFA